MDISVQDQIRLKFKDGTVCPHCGISSASLMGSLYSYHEPGFIA